MGLLISKALKKKRRKQEGSNKPPDRPMPIDEPKDEPIGEPITVEDILAIFSDYSLVTLKTEYSEKPVSIVILPSEKRELLKKGHIALTSEEFLYLMVDSNGKPYSAERQRENFRKFVLSASILPCSYLEVMPK